MRPRTFFLVNTLALIAVLVVNYLSNALPINGKTAGELSDQYPNLFVPAGLTFSIWGIIYLLLMGWVGVQVASLFNEKAYARTDEAVMRGGWWFSATCVLNIAWLLAWHYERLVLSVVFMVLLLLALLRLNKMVGVGSYKESNVEKWLSHAGFGIYQGWITVALIANVTALLVANGWRGESTWAILMIAVGVMVALWMVWRHLNVFHGIAVSWALLGIYWKRQAADIGLDVGTVAIVGAALLLVASLVRLPKWASY